MLLQALADDVHAFVEAAGRHDDMTMVVIKRALADRTSPLNPEDAEACASPWGVRKNTGD